MDLNQKKTALLDHLIQSKVSYHLTEDLITKDESQVQEKSTSDSSQGKCLLLVDNSKSFYIYYTLQGSKLDLKSLCKKLKVNKLRFASESQILETFHMTTDSVCMLMFHKNPEHSVKLILDNVIQTLQTKFQITLRETQITVHVDYNDLCRLAKTANVETVNVDNTCVDDSSKELDKKKTIVNEKIKNVQTHQGSELLGITFKKRENFPEWYTQLIVRAELVEYYDISGCYILRPWSYFIWECVQSYINKRLKKLGVDNCYFPMFVSKKKLQAEEEHLEGFNSEVAWVCRYGDSELPEPVAIRPTSETIIHPAMSRWIRSYRDLPMKLNQWCQVVRWEFKQPTPFIRTREFLWQEGHTAHATDEEAEDFMLKALSIYQEMYAKLLAIPVIKGFKSEGEKFPGAKKTCTVETVIPTNGRAVQAATSHHLGTNFSEMFNVEFEDKNKRKCFVHQTSWGVTTRSLGILVMLHGDDKGMVMPPRVAPLQVVIIPIVFKDTSMEKLQSICETIQEALIEKEIRVKIDDRDCYTAGWKYNHWETKGVCLRIEIGPRDIATQTVRIVQRDDGTKTDHSWSSLAKVVPEMLEDMHKRMLFKAAELLKKSTVTVYKWDEVLPALNAKKIILAPWCGEKESEEFIKKESAKQSLSQLQTNGNASEQSSLTGSMKPLCVPFQQPHLPEKTPCFATGKPAAYWCYFGRSY